MPPPCPVIVNVFVLPGAAWNDPFSATLPTPLSIAADLPFASGMPAREWLAPRLPLAFRLQNSNMSSMSPEAALREFKLGRPQFHWINLRMETWSMTVWETYPFFASGETTSVGTRKPRP